VTPAELRWCANGKHCVSAPALGGPARLSRSNPNSICWACCEARLERQLAVPSGQVFSLTEAAELLGVPRWRVEYLVKSGKLPVQRDGQDGRLRIAESVLEHVAEAG
jgi:excisionase family DNA binding protein